MTKKDVYVVVDTPKKAKKLKNLLDMFKEPMFTIPNNEWISHNGIDYGWGYGFSNGKWQGFNTKWVGHNGKEFKKVSIKELRNILAKEHLREGDLIFTNYGELRFWNQTESNPNNFKRYATPEEIALLEPKEVDKFAELKEAYKNGAVIEYFNQHTKEWRMVYGKPIWGVSIEYRIKPEDPVKVGDWMFNPNSKKITQVKKENHGKSLIGSGWVKIKDTELVEKLNSL